jgi:plasmid maintenance system antidote protein VapI
LRAPANRMTAIVNGERAVWVNMQAGHDLSKARTETGKQIAAEVRAHG